MTTALKYTGIVGTRAQSIAHKITACMRSRPAIRAVSVGRDSYDRAAHVYHVITMAAIMKYKLNMDLRPND